jgi:hypothetical protein
MNRRWFLAAIAATLGWRKNPYLRDNDFFTDPSIARRILEIANKSLVSLDSRRF